MPRVSTVNNSAKCVQKRPRHVRMMRLNGIIEPVRHFAMIGQHAMPLAFIVSEAAQLPPRQLDGDQGKDGVGPGASCDQAIEALGFRRAAHGGQAFATREADRSEGRRVKRSHFGRCFGIGCSLNRDE
jgi:hypothetical protein